jgi:flavin reductase (DIM6/NTAB) family NADH-FMN oxidoreductase RutF
MVTPDEFKHVMRRWGSTVTVVTTKAGDRLHGLTVTAFSSLSVHPPMVFVCINKGARGHDAIAEAGVFCVNFLGPDMKEISDRFARPSTEDRFAGLDIRVEATGSPILPGVLAFLDCRVGNAFAAGDHTIYTGVVEAAGVARPDESPLLYFHGGYHALGEKL